MTSLEVEVEVTPGEGKEMTDKEKVMKEWLTKHNLNVASIVKHFQGIELQDLLAVDETEIKFLFFFAFGSHFLSLFCFCTHVFFQ